MTSGCRRPTTGDLRLEDYSVLPIIDNAPAGDITRVALTQDGLYGLAGSGNAVFHWVEGATQGTLVSLGISAAQVA